MDMDDDYLDGHHDLEEFDDFLYIGQPQTLDGTHVYLDAPFSIQKISQVDAMWRVYILPFMRLCEPGEVDTTYSE